jgi:addiction module HigA family antidote
MIQTVADRETQQFFVTGKSKRLPPDLVKRALRWLEYLHVAAHLNDLLVPPSNQLHALQGDRAGQYSISINDQWRICFRFVDGDAYDVEITDYIEERTMAIANTEPRQIPPTHPGEMLREDFMPDFGLTATALASALRVSRQTVHQLLREERAITPLMALRLARLFGNSPAFWLNAQQARDLWEAEQNYQEELLWIGPITASRGEVRFQ